MFDNAILIEETINEIILRNKPINNDDNLIENVS
jgi:hypothetical protein